MGTELKKRVATNLGRAPGAEVEPPQRKKTLAEQIESKIDVFQKAMPRGVEARQLIRDAMSLIRKNPDLGKCDVHSVIGGLMTFAQLGLRPGVLGHGWLIPFKRRVKNDRGQWVDVWEAQIVIGYLGYAELVHRSGAVETMVGRTIHANDVFDLEYGLEDRLIHKPFMSGDRGEPVGYYAIIKYKGGGYVFWHMTKSEGESWRDRYAMARKRIYENGKPTDATEIVGPWRDNFDEMVTKTCYLRAQKWAPKGTDLVLARAAAVDGAVRTDTDDDPDAMFDAPHPDPYIEGELVNDPTEQPAAAAEEEKPTPPPVVDVGTPAPAPAREMQTEFPPVPGTGDAPPASPGLLSSIARMVGDGGITDDRVRKAVISRIAGLPGPVGSTAKLSAAEGRQVLQFLSGWEAAGTLAPQLEAVAAASAPPADEPATGQKLPQVGSKTWHTDRHPRVVGDQVERVAVELNGDCGICEEDATTK